MEDTADQTLESRLPNADYITEFHQRDRNNVKSLRLELKLDGSYCSIETLRKLLTSEGVPIVQINKTISAEFPDGNDIFVYGSWGAGQNYSLQLEGNESITYIRLLSHQIGSDKDNAVHLVDALKKYVDMYEEKQEFLHPSGRVSCG